MVVMKFGGTSVKDAAAIKNVIEIVNGQSLRKPLVVLSACSGITDKLLEAVHMAASSNPSKSFNIISDIRNFHIELAEKLIGDTQIRNSSINKINTLADDAKILCEGVSLLKECTLKSADAAASFGELLSTTIFYYALKATGTKTGFLDARKVMLTDSNFSSANIDCRGIASNCSEIISPMFKDNNIVITQGFIASDKEGCTTTLGRGGSDYTAAVLGAAINAEEIQIWTDVDGVLSADPRLVDDVIAIKLMQFDEMKELSFFGAKVLHPETVKPAIEKKIPVKVLNTFAPEQEGTLLVDDGQNALPKINSIVLKDKCLAMESNNTDNNIINFSKLLKSLSKKKITIYHSQLYDNKFEIICENKKETVKSAEDYGLDTEEISLLVFTGTGLKAASPERAAIVEKIVNSLSGFGTKALIAGFSNNSILTALEQKDALSALKYCHNKIFNKR